MEQSKKSAITKEKILSAAEDEFSLCGLAAARVDSIAQKAGVNKQLIYAHFGNKENLYSVILEKVYARLGEYEKNLVYSDFEGCITVKKIILDYFDFLVSNPSFVRLMLWENLNGAQCVGEVRTNLFTGTRNLLYKGIEAGVIRDDIDVEQTAMSFNLFCFSAFSNVYTISKLLGKDLTTKQELIKRANHIADVLVTYTIKGDSQL
ncbi:MAG: TetR family transcriptional regulator [Clostridia bacterium]|nr:TetR family transcriptional regulator [Clostridia bacterium]